MTGRRTRYIDRRASITKEIAEIDDLISLAKAADDLEVRGHLSRLAVIRLSGLIESSLAHMVNGYLEEHTTHRVLRFSQRVVKKLPNLTPARLIDVVDGLDPDWSAELDALLSVDEKRQALSNLIGARHTLAHGGSTAVSTARVDEYRDVAVETIHFLMSRLLPLP